MRHLSWLGVGLLAMVSPGLAVQPSLPPASLPTRRNVPRQTPPPAPPVRTPLREMLRPQNAGHAWSFARRKGVTRFEVRSGDKWSEDGTAAKERSEAYGATHLAACQRYRIAFRLMVAPGPPNSAEWLSLVQLQSTFDRGEAGHSPPFAIELAQERMRVVTRSSPARRSSLADTQFTKQYEDPRPIERGKWYDIAIDVRFDPFGAGALQVTRDGVRLVDYHGPLGFDDAVGPYLKQGIYRAPAPEPMVAFFSDSAIVALPPDRAALTAARSGAPVPERNPRACR